jgi:anti-sigma factor RsiW
MTKNITSREWETLSAYLDGYLTQKERQRLEERLLSNMELRNGLEELRRTRQVLRSQPKMRAPRNFTLTPEMVGVKASRRSVARIFPVMRLASVLASILLVLVVVGDLLTIPVSQPAQMDMARSGVEVTEAEMPAMEEAAEMLAAAPEVEGASEKAMEPDATPPGEVMMMAAPTEELQDPQAEPPAALTMPSGSGGQPAEESAAADAELSLPTETPLPTVEPTPAPVEEPAPASPPARSHWRTAEILLALIAISSGLIALYLRRSLAR